jgi:hypothetical protein
MAKYNRSGVREEEKVRIGYILPVYLLGLSQYEQINNQALSGQHIRLGLIGRLERRHVAGRGT